MPAKKSAAKKTTRSPKVKKAVSSKTKSQKAGDREVTIDRRLPADRRDKETAGPAAERRKKVQRRRQIDPTTCERDYTEHEVEFMNAMDEYKRKSGRMFPTCSEVLEVIRGLGYVKLTPAELALYEANQGEADDQPNSDISSSSSEFEASDESEELVTNGWTL
ncbi:MAG: hypothetical protein KDA57_04025 [Planctomycetales bacterium]|nr:hypothetical protein [Planctomycetales bacterium]